MEKTFKKLDNNKTIRAWECRKKFIDGYIDFEHLIKKVARSKIDGYKIKKQSLSNVIQKLRIENQKQDLKLPIIKIRQHHRIRNWLVHQLGNAQCPVHYFKIISDIKNLNQILKKQK